MGVRKGELNRRKMRDRRKVGTKIEGIREE
jgi:hypothetical protein